MFLGSLKENCCHPSTVLPEILGDVINTATLCVNNVVPSFLSFGIRTKKSRYKPPSRPQADQAQIPGPRNSELGGGLEHFDDQYINPLVSQ